MTRGRAARLSRLVLAVGAVLALACSVLWWSLPPGTWVDRARFVHYRDAHTVTDRHGVPLRLTRTDGMDRRWVSLGDVSPTLVDAVLAAEDVRFRQHAGVDVRAVLRAALLNLVPGRPRSGASTVTQQLVKLVYGRPAGLASKLTEIVRAAALERLMTKDEILEQYLNRVPFGDRIEGVARASEAYFGHPVARLSVAEAALLAGVPQAPSITEPRRHLPRALVRRNRVLDRMHGAGLIDDRALATARSEAPVIVATPPHPHEAPRFVDRVLSIDAASDARHIGPLLRTSLDLELQHQAERTLLAAVERLSPRGVTNGAAVIVDSATGEVVAYVGAARRDGHGGSLDLLQRGRQPGSTLKPFVYELLFEKGATAATVLDDISVAREGARGSQFEAHDYDRKERGPVRARVALSASLNLAALDAATRVGQDSLTARLGQLGLRNLGEASRYGAAAVLGGIDVAPFDLARAYVTLARRGQSIPLVVTPISSRPTGRAVMQARAAALTTDILSDARARAEAFGSDLTELAPRLRFAVKTGTSSGWRDAWTAAYTPQFTVVVWLGDPAGAPLASVSGFEAAAPVAVRLLAAAHDRAPALLASGSPSLRDATPLAADSKPSSSSTDLGPAIAGSRPSPSTSLAPTAPALSMELVPASICAWTGRRPGPRCGHVIEEHFLRGTQPTDECTDHDTDGSIRLPPRYTDWVKRTHPAGVSTRWLEPTTTPTLLVREPADGSRLLVDPTRGALHLRLRATSAGREVTDVTWLLDGHPLPEATWTPSPGTHTLVARRGSTSSPPARVVITVP